MLNQDPKYNRGIPDLTDMTQEELLEYFKTLEAPTIEEMDGARRSTRPETAWAAATTCSGNSAAS